MDALSNIRIEIDHIDRELIRLLAQRQKLVEKAGRLKPKGDKAAVQASDRVAQVIANRRKEALELGLSPDVKVFGEAWLKPLMLWKRKWTKNTNGADTS